MKATMTMIPWTGARTLTVTFEPGDFFYATFDDVDRRLLEECSQSQSVADWLIGAEMIARRVEQRTKESAR